MPRQLEVRITYCCCCGLTVATVLIAIYTIVVYGVLLGLASNSLSRLDRNIPDPSYEGPLTISDSRLEGDGVRVIVDVDPYYYSMGLYTEEIKFSNFAVRRAVLGINITIYIAMILASILVFVALCTGLHWLIVAWMVVMVVDIIRGIISCIFIFVFSGGNIRQIAVGIFFLGLQLFHMSLLLIMFAKFQRMQNKKNGIDYKVVERHGERSILMDGSQVYPTLPGSAYAYSSSPHYRREVGYYTGPHPDERRGHPYPHPQILDAAHAGKQHGTMVKSPA